MKSSNPIVFMDLKIDDEKVGRIIIELFANIVPRTVENFLALCIGNHVSDQTGKKLHYKGTIFHKVLPRVFIQGGDVTNFDGSSGESIFGLAYENENSALKHDGPGLLSSVSNEENKNNSQFIITVEECPHLDGSCVVFGKVLKGFACVIDVLKVSEVKTENDHPLSRCIIEDCGELLLGEPWNFIDKDETNDAFPPDPRDVELNDFTLPNLLNILEVIKESGNYFFLKRNYTEADRKYKKAVRYIDYWTSPKFENNLNKSTKNEAVEEFGKVKMCCLLNSAAVALEKGLYRKSLNLCDEVIKKEKGNAKAYFRRGKALKYLNDYEGALTEQKKALSLAPNDKSIWSEIAKINSMKKNYLVEEKKVFSRMFNSFK